MVDAREYHAETNHTLAELRESDFELDFANRPRPDKVYRDLPEVGFEGDPALPETPVLAAVAEPDARPHRTADGPLDAAALHALCFGAGGVTKTLERNGRQIPYRAASCTGKLYHVDLYAVTGDLGDLAAAVYHYDPHDDALELLREGDYRGVLAAAAGGQAGVAAAPVTLVATSQWWRNAWKYRERTYRHAFWDSGTVLANLLATAHGLGHRAEVVAAFADDPVAELLGLDPTEEAPLELVPVGADALAPDPPAVASIDPAEEPLSPNPREYPLIHDAWAQSRLSDGDTAAGWRADFGPAGTRDRGGGEVVELDPVDDDTASARPVGATIRRRGSLREYAHDPISDRMLATVLDRASRGVPVDALGGARLVDWYCLVHAVEGVPSGAYQYHPDADLLERVGDTDRETAGDLALGQSVVGDAAVNVYCMADVDALVERHGNRAYRLAQLAAGIDLGRLYLATYAHRALGGRGFTFFDEDVTAHLSPAAAGQSPMTLFAFGTPPEA